MNILNLDDFGIVIGVLPSAIFPQAKYYKWAVLQPTVEGKYLVYPNDNIQIGEVKGGKLIARYVPEIFNSYQDATKFVDEMVV